MKAEDGWRPSGRDGQNVYKRGRSEYRVQYAGFISKVYLSHDDAKRLGWREFEDGLGRTHSSDDEALGHDSQGAAAAAAAAAKARPKRVCRRKALPVAPTDGAQKQQQPQQPLPKAAAAAAAARTKAPSRKRRQEAPPPPASPPAATTALPAAAAAAAAAAQPNKRRKHNAGRVAARPGSQLATAVSGGDATKEQTPSAATDAATAPPQDTQTHAKQEAAAGAARQAAAAAAGKQAGKQAGKAGRKRGRQQAAAAAGPDAATAGDDKPLAERRGRVTRRQQQQQAQQKQQQLPHAQGTQHTDPYSIPSEYTGVPPSSPAHPQQEAQKISESAGSNWVPPAPPAAAAAAAAATEALAAGAAGAAATAAAGSKVSSMTVSHQGSRASKVSLEVQVQQQLGKGGFGAVHRVLVKATGPNSLAGLKLAEPLSSSLKAVIKEHRVSNGAERVSNAGGGRGSRQQQPSSRSRAGSRGGSSDGDGSSDGSSGSTWVPMALKVALGFEQLSNEMQDNFKTAAAYEANVSMRMGQEYELMCACAGSPHIVDAFCRGLLWVGDAWRPCILMELSGLGDAEKVFLRPGSSSARSTGSVLTQRIVRQAAVALRDLHSMACSIHLDLKINNLLVFGSRDKPRVKLCDFGCAKKRTDKPRYGPASGTKDWQAPEQMAPSPGDEEDPTAGRLDYCTDSWALGMLVLCLRKGKQPFWWLKEDNTLPSEVPYDLPHYVTDPSHPYGQDSPPGSRLTAKEVAFVTTCLADSSSSRPDVCTLLEHNPYLSSRYRGG